VFRMNVRGDGWASGRFLQVDPPRRIVFTWGWEIERSPLPPGSSVVEVELIPQGDATLVRLTHRDLPPVRSPSTRPAGRTTWTGWRSVPPAATPAPTRRGSAPEAPPGYARSRTSRTVAATLAAVGTTACSRLAAKGRGTQAPATRRIGASRS
jgi:Activator of Hsp90 ATPase homolog 1-like protein